MENLLEQYAKVVGNEVIDHLRQLAHPLKGMKILHINSTKEGGGVAEILNRLIPLKRELGIEAEWEIITGEKEFYQCTKKFHNSLQGNKDEVSDHLLEVYKSTNAQNFDRLRSKLVEADVVFIHDPQPAALLSFCKNERRGKWIWRCHIDVSHPFRPAWKFLRDYIRDYDSSIWSLSSYVQQLPHPLFLIPPSIDPLSEKNAELPEKEINYFLESWGLKKDIPILTQVSRFDRFKDPVGVIQAYRLIKRYSPVQLVLAGGGASDDPEGQQVLNEVKTFAGDDPDIHVLELPPDAHRAINALQRGSNIILQKSLKEGFGLTVTEGLWKGKPVIGGDTGGIRLQVINHFTGFLVNSPEGAAMRIRYLMKHPEMVDFMGKNAREYVLHNFLITRHLREYLTLICSLVFGSSESIELQMPAQLQTA